MAKAKQEITVDGVEYDPDLPDCYIFDVDGTLALMHDRGPYEWDKIGEDLPNELVISLYNALEAATEVLAKRYDFIIVSGRDEICRPETLRWLDKNFIDFDELHMRPAGSMEKDTVIKQRIYEEHIKGKYNVLGIFDDRNQVVEMWRGLGLPVFQVADNNF